MQRQLQVIYRCKLQNIQQKFKLISQAYSKMAVEINQKNQLIQDLSRAIQILQISLQQANSKLQQAKVNIQQLQVRLEKQTVIKNVFIGTQSKASAFTPQSPKINSYVTPLSSQTFLKTKIPIQRDVKQSKQSEKSREMLQKYQSLLKNLPANQKAILLGDQINKIQKSIQERPLEVDTSPKRWEQTPKMQKLGDLTNLNFGYNKLEVKSKQQIGFQTRPITHQRSITPKISQVVNKQAAMKTLTKIWQERDRQIQKMDELFQSINSKLKDFQQ